MSERVTCANCGFLNEPGDEFCGDCGTYLAWSGASGRRPQGARQLAAGPGTDRPVRRRHRPPPAAPPPPATPPAAAAATATAAARRHRRPSRPAAGLPGATQPTAARRPQGYQVMPPPAMGGQPCRTCGLVNPPGRSFCQRCGQRLDPAVGTMAGSPRPAPGRGRDGRGVAPGWWRQTAGHRGHLGRPHRGRGRSWRCS